MLVFFYPLFLSIPIVLTTIFGYDIPPSFLVLPLVFISLIKSYRSLDAVFFMASIILGLLSCLLGEIIQSSDAVMKPILSMTLILIAPSFIFLGQSIICKSYSFKKTFEYLAIFSSIFSIVLVARLLLNGSIFRYEIDPSVTDINIGSNLDAKFMGFPVFGSWGVLSLAHLFCVQTFICSGTLVGDKVQMPIRILSGIGLLCFIYLIIGSDSRSAQLGTTWLIGTYIFYKFNSWNKRLFVAAVLAAILGFVLFYSIGYSENSRLVISIQESVSGSSLSDLSTGRTDLINAALKDLENNSVIGVGFGTFNRFLNGFSSEHTLNNSSTHIYLLTILWKGGLIFAVPFFGMLFVVSRKLWKSRNKIFSTSEEYFALNAIFVSFFILSMTWDILIVPTTGALVFFLLGMLSVSKHKLNNNIKVI